MRLLNINNAMLEPLSSINLGLLSPLIPTIHMQIGLWRIQFELLHWILNIETKIDFFQYTNLYRVSKTERIKTQHWQLSSIIRFKGCIIRLEFLIIRVKGLMIRFKGLMIRFKGLIIRFKGIMIRFKCLIIR